MGRNAPFYCDHYLKYFMSVFTTITTAELETWLNAYAIGDLVSLKGISAGITNTNYFVTTTHAKYVLTIFEENTAHELPFFIDLMSHLSEQHIPCPLPIKNKLGVALSELHGKPAVLVSCLKGCDVEQPNTAQCAAVGRALAQMHLAGSSFKADMRNQRGADWRQATAEKVLPVLSESDQALLQSELTFIENLDLSVLPTGVIHADLFRDNVLMDNDQVGGIIDLYYACKDALAYDVAIAVNDWCVFHDGHFDNERLNAFLNAYQQIRPFEAAENAHWNNMLRIAALRFWLSRLKDKHFPLAGELTHAKDPDHFYRILKLRITAI